MKEKQPSPPLSTEKAPAELAQAFVLQLFGQRQDGRLLVHNYALAAETAGRVTEIARSSNASPEVAERARLAAWFYPTGYLYDYQNPASYSEEIARQFFSQIQYEEEGQQAILQAIRQVAEGGTPRQEEGRILNDAVFSSTYLTQEEERLPMLQMEREFFSGRRFSKAEWAKVLLDELLRIKLLTHYGQGHFQPLLSQAVHDCRKQLEKSLDKETEEGRFAALEKKSPVRGNQTFFRSNYRNHINLSAIADNKANIMISVNAILISVLITFLSYRNIGENNPRILLPVVIFLVTGLASLIFAVLSARPKVTMLNRSETPPEEARRNIVFFGNFVNMELDEFEESMDEVLNDSRLLYGNMVRDLYFLGKVLDKKYRFLTISYNIFMIGFVATVTTFLIALFS